MSRTSWPPDYEPMSSHTHMHTPLTKCLTHPSSLRLGIIFCFAALPCSREVSCLNERRYSQTATSNTADVP